MAKSNLKLWKDYEREQLKIGIITNVSFLKLLCFACSSFKKYNNLIIHIMIIIFISIHMHRYVR